MKHFSSSFFYYSWDLNILPLILFASSFLQLIELPGHGTSRNCTHSSTDASRNFMTMASNASRYVRRCVHSSHHLATSGEFHDLFSDFLCCCCFCFRVLCFVPYMFAALPNAVFPEPLPLPPEIITRFLNVRLFRRRDRGGENRCFFFFVIFFFFLVCVAHGVPIHMALVWQRPDHLIDSCTYPLHYQPEKWKMKKKNNKKKIANKLYRFYNSWFFLLSWLRNEKAVFFYNFLLNHHGACVGNFLVRRQIPCITRWFSMLTLLSNLTPILKIQHLLLGSRVRWRRDLAAW